MEEIHKERLRLWVAALRSGEYTQASGRLHDSRGYCCLGVACEVAVKNGLDLDVTLPYDDGTEDTVHRSIHHYNGEGDVLPLAVQLFYGLNGGDPCIGSDEEFPGLPPLSAATANDSRKMTFQQIADLVEQHYGLVE